MTRSDRPTGPVDLGFVTRGGVLSRLIASCHTWTIENSLHDVRRDCSRMPSSSKNTWRSSSARLVVAEILLTLKVEPGLVKALDKAAADVGEVTRSMIATALLRDWLITSGYFSKGDLEEDNPVEGEG